MEPQNYSYPTDSEPNHILSCPDWKEDLVKYKKERLHIPHKIITVPKVTNPSFKAPTYVEIPKTKRLFSQNRKNKRISPTMGGGGKPPYKLTITGSNITVHQYPKGSPQKSEEGQGKVETVVKPVSEVSAIIKEENTRPSLALKSSILSDGKSSTVATKTPPPRLSLNIPKSPERNKTKSEWGGKYHGHASPKATSIHHGQHSPKTSYHSGSGHSPKASLKHMSPLMKKVHKAMKQERQRMSCSGRGVNTPGAVVSRSPRSPVRGMGSPFRVSSPGRSPYRPESPVASTSTTQSVSTTPVHALPGSRSPAHGSSEHRAHSPTSQDSAPSTPDIANMSSEELGYEKVKPKVASPFKHSVTSTANKLAERLGVSIDLKKKPIPETENPFEKYRKMYKEQLEKQKQEEGNENELAEVKDEVEETLVKENTETIKKSKKKKKKKDKEREREKEKEKDKLQKSDSLERKDFTIDDLKCLPHLGGKCKKNKGKDQEDCLSLLSTCSSQKAKKRKHKLMDDTASVASSCSNKSGKKKKKVAKDGSSAPSNSGEHGINGEAENPNKKKEKVKKNTSKEEDKVSDGKVGEKSKKKGCKESGKSGKKVKGVEEVETNTKSPKKNGNKGVKERSLPSTPDRRGKSQPCTPTRATRCKSEAPGTPKTPKGTPKRLTKLGQELRKNVVTPKSKQAKSNAKKERKKREEEQRRKKQVGDRRRKRRSMLDELWSSDGYVAEKRFRKNNDLLADPSELGREERALQVRTVLLLIN